jgi:hypothetical protein
LALRPARSQPAGRSRSRRAVRAPETARKARRRSFAKICGVCQHLKRHCCGGVAGRSICLTGGWSAPTMRSRRDRPWPPFRLGAAQKKLAIALRHPLGRSGATG